MSATEGTPLFPTVPLSLKKPLIMASAFAVLGLVASGLLGHIWMGACGVLGLALGLLNIKLVQRAVAKVTAEDHPSKQKLAVSSAGRLALVTVVALGFGIFFKPDGLGVFVGLAVFQVILVINTSVPVLKGLRQQS